MEIFLTISGGVMVFVIGQLIVEAFLKPILDQREVLGAITSEVVFYSNVTNADLDKHTIASQKIRGLASKLTAKTSKILFYRIFSVIGFVYSQKKIETLEVLLIDLSNIEIENEGVTDTCKVKLAEIKTILNVKR